MASYRVPDYSSIRWLVYRGAFMHSSHDQPISATAMDSAVDNTHPIYTFNQWRTPRWKLLVFISSTFTDTGHERNILLAKILPKLRQEARLRNIEISFVDMRFGVRDESTLDHRTWFDCANELKRCHDDSAGLFFLSLQAEKYGYRPLPRDMDKEAFDEKVHNWKTSSAANDEGEKIDVHDLVKLAGEWYSLDDNAVPEGRYLLRKLESTNDSDYWDRILPKLRSALSEVSFNASSCNDLIVGRSVSEWEVKYAVHLDSNTARLGWLRRRFADGVDDTLPNVRNFFDAQEPTVRNRLENLKSWIESTFSAPPKYKWEQHHSSIFAGRLSKDSNQWEPTIVSCGGQLTMQQYVAGEGSEFDAYITDWQMRVERRLGEEIEKVKLLKSTWCGGEKRIPIIKGDMMEEILHHYEWAHEKCATFIGREELIQQALDIILEPRRITETKGRFDCISLCLIGRSGCGKTALMARLAHELYEIESQRTEVLYPLQLDGETVAQTHGNYKRPILIRFCGTSSMSNDVVGIVRSLSNQILSLTNEGYGFSPIADEYEKQLQRLAEMLKAYPMVLFIDSLDQLTDLKQGRSQISFLANMEVHPDSRIIVSALPNERDAHTGEFIYCYGCDTRMREGNVPRLDVPIFDTTSSSARTIMETLLHRRGRRLTEPQWKYVMQRVEAEPTALYVNLALSIVSQWSSSFVPTATPEQHPLAATVSGVISQILDGVENMFGRVLTQAALTLLTISIGGIMDAELEDILSMDESVLNFVFQYHTPTLRRLPSHVWSRIRTSLSGLLIERERGCVVWYHRQLNEVSRVRYGADKEQSAHMHSLIGKYYANIVDEETRNSRAILAQPLVLNATSQKGNVITVWHKNAQINRRRCQQAGHHLIEAGMYSEAITELCQLEMVLASVKSNTSFELLQNMSRLHSLLQTGNNRNVTASELKRLEDYSSWMRVHVTALLTSNDPGCVLLASCTHSQPAISIVRHDAMKFIEVTAQQNVEFMLRKEMEGKPVELFVGNCTQRAMYTPKFVERGLLQAKLTGHKKRVFCVAWSPDGEKIASGGEKQGKYGDAFIWDSQSGIILNLLHGHKGDVYSTAWDHTGQYIVTASADHTMRIWESISGMVVRTLTGHTREVRCAKWSADSTRIASSGYDNTVRMWNALTGELLWTGEEHSEYVFSVDWHCGDSKIVSAGGCINVWDSDQGSLLKNIREKRKISRAQFSPDGNTLALGLSDGTVSLFETQSFERRADLKPKKSHNLYAICWKYDNQQIAVSCDNLVKKIYKQRCDVT